jgi:hypothetical protein
MEYVITELDETEESAILEALAGIVLPDDIKDKVKALKKAKENA